MNISLELANQIIGYLGTRPYQEVFQLVAAIQEAAAAQGAQNGGKMGTEGDQKAGGAA